MHASLPVTIQKLFIYLLLSLTVHHMGPLLTDMPLVASFMDSRSEGSGTSFSCEDCPSPSESERGGEKRVCVERRGKRRVKNRDAARKSRKKQTERADYLHHELQTLEHSNSALQKEIAVLKREFQHYTSNLEQHEPFCSLRPSSVPHNALCCQLLSPSTSSIAPLTTPGPAVSPQTTPGSLLTSVTGGQRASLPAPVSLPFSILTTVPSAAHVTNAYPFLATLTTPITKIAPLTTPITNLAPLTTPITNLAPPTTPITKIAPLTTPITNLAPTTTPITNLAPPTTPITNLAPPTTPRTNLAPPTTPITNLAPPTTPASFPSISYPLTLYPMNLSTPAIDPSIELFLSDLLDSPYWLDSPASPTWGTL